VAGAQAAQILLRQVRTYYPPICPARSARIATALLHDLAAMDQPFAAALDQFVLIATFGGHVEAVQLRAAGHRHPVAAVAGAVSADDVDDGIAHHVVHDRRRIVGRVLVLKSRGAACLHVGDDLPDLVAAAEDLAFHDELGVLGEGGGVDIGIEGVEASGIAHQRRLNCLPVDVILE